MTDGGAAGSARTRAVVLLSGGLDSSTVLAMAIEKGREVHALSLDYGQRHRVELEAAARVARSMGVASHKVLAFDLRDIGGSSLTGDGEVPKHHTVDEMEPGIPSTYVPARNTLFLAFALAWAEVLGAPEIYIGVNALDYSGYPDCRMDYIEAFQRMANLATRCGVEGHPVRIIVPLVERTKAEIIRVGTRLGVDYSLTHSCYDPDAEGLACGECDSCLLRLKGFEEAGLEDPVAYSTP